MLCLTNIGIRIFILDSMSDGHVNETHIPRVELMRCNASFGALIMPRIVTNTTLPKLHYSMLPSIMRLSRVRVLEVQLHVII